MNKKEKIIFKGKLTPARLNMLRCVFVKKTIAAVSKETGLPKVYLSEIETRRAHPPIIHMKAILNVMDVKAKNPHMTRCEFEENSRFI